MKRKQARLNRAESIVLGTLLLAIIVAVFLAMVGPYVCNEIPPAIDSSNPLPPAELLWRYPAPRPDFISYDPTPIVYDYRVTDSGRCVRYTGESRLLFIDQIELGRLLGEGEWPPTDALDFYVNGKRLDPNQWYILPWPRDGYVLAVDSVQGPAFLPGYHLARIQFVDQFDRTHVYQWAFCVPGEGITCER